MIFLATPLLVLFAWLLGRALASVLAPARISISTCLAAGLVAWHVLLQTLALAGWPWHWLWLAAAAAAAAGTVLWRRRTETAIRTEKASPVVTPPIGWGDALAVLVWLLVTWAVVMPYIDNPDFFYHWGVKGRKFAVAMEIDWSFLTGRSAWLIHPDYPNLLPELTSWTIRLARSFAEGPQLLWSSAFFAGLLLAAREAAAALGMSRRTQQIALASTAAGVGTMAFGAELGGNADWLVAWAMVLALPALLWPAAPGAPFRVAAAAALAASSKIEGVPMAVLMVGVFVLHRGAAERESWRAVGTAILRSALKARLPVAAVVAVVLPWWVLCRRYGLFQNANHSEWQWARFQAALPGLLEGILSPVWGGLAVTVLAVPWLVTRPRIRWPALMVLAQLGFYLYVYASAPVATYDYVHFSWTRLLLHVLPAIWLLAAAELDGTRAAGEPLEG